MVLTPVYNRRIAQILINEGWKLEKLERNINNKEFMVYLFEKTPEFVQRREELVQAFNVLRNVK